MAIETDSKKFAEIFKKLPEDLREAVYAQETGEDVEAICDRNKITHHFDYVIDGILSVYTGNLKPDVFFTELEKKLGEGVSTRQIFFEIDKFLIAPYKDSLDKLYSTDTTTQAATN